MARGFMVCSVDHPPPVPIHQLTLPFHPPNPTVSTPQTPPPSPPFLPHPPGYDGRVDDSLRRALKVTRYQSSKARITYSDYSAHKAAAATCREEARGEAAADAVGEVASVYA